MVDTLDEWVWLPDSNA
ncbi:hypothetical protein A2U01_0065649, partial [Trifolium medium]|nr:hypothetical protein [Trifolium medium]